MSKQKNPEKSCQTRAPETITEETREQVRHSCYARGSRRDTAEVELQRNYLRTRCVIRVA